MQLAVNPFTVVAVIVAVPTPVPVTTPSLFTGATLSSLLVHVTVLSAALLGDTVAVKDKVSPTTMSALVLLSKTDFGYTSVTFTVHLALNPFTVVAVIVAVPMSSPVTTPSLFTEATFSSLLVHVTVLSAELPGDTVAVKDKVSPNSILSLVLLSEIDVGTAVAAFTVTVQLALKPFTVVAVIFAVPAPVPVTTPSLFTTATFSLLLVHVTVLSVALFGDTVAVKVKFSPTSILAVCLSSETDVGYT